MQTLNSTLQTYFNVRMTELGIWAKHRIKIIYRSLLIPLEGRSIFEAAQQGPAFRTRNQIFESEFKSEREFCKNKNSNLTRYILLWNIRNIPCFEFCKNMKVRMSFCQSYVCLEAKNVSFEVNFVYFWPCQFCD